MGGGEEKRKEKKKERKKIRKNEKKTPKKGNINRGIRNVIISS